MKSTRRHDAETKKEKRERFRQWKKPLLVANDYRCQLCGIQMRTGLHLHHVLPYARFPELEFDTRNVLVLCNDCHREIHTNPFLECRMIEEKAEEMGIDISEVDGRDIQRLDGEQD